MFVNIKLPPPNGGVFVAPLLHAFPFLAWCTWGGGTFAVQRLLLGDGGGGWRLGGGCALGDVEWAPWHPCADGSPAMEP